MTKIKFYHNRIKSKILFENGITNQIAFFRKRALILDK